LAEKYGAKATLLTSKKLATSKLVSTKLRFIIGIV